MLRLARSLSGRAGVLRAGAFLMEGPRFVSDYMAQGGRPSHVILAEGASGPAEGMAAGAEGQGLPVILVPTRLFDGLADTVTSQGLAAICPLPEPSGWEDGEKDLLLLDGLGDPGNVGTVIRTAAAMGIGAVVCGRGTCCPFIPKVTRASAGTNALIPVPFDVDLPALMDRLGDAAVCVGAGAGGSRPREAIESTGGRIALVLGSEAAGISAEVAGRLDRRVWIGMDRGVESLNAAASAAILMWEMRRGRP